jgi:predicted CoA-substrate-specific enzyme activase
MKYFVGIDIGASTTKAIIIDEKKEIRGHGVNDSGADFSAAADRAYAAAREGSGCGDDDTFVVVTTGYGRRNVPYADETRTEISCHAEGSFHYYPQAHTLVDIGGQDNKIIKIDDDGRRISFKMNRKCAAGTGAFLEEMANRLKIDLGRLNDMASKAENNIQLGSYCTVFTGTEILAKIREGVDAADIIKGLFNSIIKRVLEMDSMNGTVVMSGGVVAYNPYLVTMFEEKTGSSIFVPPLPQLTGAFGAALYALKHQGGSDA